MFSFVVIKSLPYIDQKSRLFPRANEYQLSDCAKYFLDNVERLGQHSYIPTTQVFLTSYKNIELDQEHFSGDPIDWGNLTHASAQDILHTRVRTSGIVEVRGKVNFF